MSAFEVIPSVHTIECHLFNVIEDKEKIIWNIQCDVARNQIPIYLRIVYYKNSYVTPSFTVYGKKECEVNNVTDYLNEVMSYFFSFELSEYHTKSLYVAKPCFRGSEVTHFFYYDILNYRFQKKE